MLTSLVWMPGQLVRDWINPGIRALWRPFRQIQRHLAYYATSLSIYLFSFTTKSILPLISLTVVLNLTL